jgi:hypothetical protein
VTLIAGDPSAELKERQSPVCRLGMVGDWEAAAYGFVGVSVDESGGAEIMAASPLSF